MYTLGELADELNRQEWAVEKMLKNRGYLKNNGDPRKSTIDDGLMNKNGLIKEAGWSVFIDELGYKKSDDDEDEEEEIEDIDEDDVDDDEYEDEDIDDDDVEDNEEEDDDEEEDSDKFIKYYKDYEIRFDAIQNCYFALKDDDVQFSNEDLSYLENEIDDWISWNHSPKIFSCDCVFCRNGTCKNDENPYNYDENCPGDCDYFYRK